MKYVYNQNSDHQVLLKTALVVLAGLFVVSLTSMLLSLMDNTAFDWPRPIDQSALVASEQEEPKNAATLTTENAATDDSAQNNLNVSAQASPAPQQLRTNTERWTTTRSAPSGTNYPASQPAVQPGGVGGGTSEPPASPASGGSSDGNSRQSCDCASNLVNNATEPLRTLNVNL